MRSGVVGILPSIPQNRPARAGPQSIPESRAKPILIDDPRLVQFLRRFAVALLGFVICALPVPSAALPIDIVSRTSLDLSTHTIGREIVVTGRASDDLGRGLGFRRVRVQGTADQGEFSVEAMTDGRGLFRVNRIVAPGEWSVSGRFVGDLFTGADEAEEIVEVRDRAPRVAFAVPAIVPVSEPSAELLVQVTVGGRPALGAAVTFASDCGQVIGGASVGPDGVARATFRFSDGATGLCTIEAQITGQRRFGPASAVATLRRFETPTLRLRGEFERGAPFAEGEWKIWVEAFDRYGSLDGARVELSRGEQELAAALVSPGGALITLPESVIGAESSVVATLVPDVGDLRLSTEPLVLVRPPSPSRVFGSWSTGFALLFVVVILVGVAREIRRSKPRTEKPKVVVAGVSAEVAPDGVEGVITAVVRDAEDSRTLAATLTLVDSGERTTTESDGVVHLEAAPRIAFEASAPGYLPLRGSITPPPKGRRAVIRLKSVRAEVRDVLRDVIERLQGKRSRWWGRSTVRVVSAKTLAQARTLRSAPERESTHRAELARLLLDAREAHGEAEALEALTLLVDDIYFGGGGEIAAVELAHELAEATRRLG